MSSRAMLLWMICVCVYGEMQEGCIGAYGQFANRPPRRRDAAMPLQTLQSMIGRANQ